MFGIRDYKGLNMLYKVGVSTKQSKTLNVTQRIWDNNNLGNETYDSCSFKSPGSFSLFPSVSSGFPDHTGNVTLYEPLSNVPYLCQNYCQCGKIEPAVENILSLSAL